MTSTADVMIHVGDDNDNPPTFERHPTSPMNTTYRANAVNTTYLVSTRAQRGYVITRLRTSDADSGANARVTFQLADVTARDVASASASGLFHVDRDIGVVKVAGDLSDRDGVTFELIVVAMDGGEPPMSAFATVSVAVNSSVSVFPCPSSLLRSRDQGLETLLCWGSFNRGLGSFGRETLLPRSRGPEHSVLSP